MKAGLRLRSKILGPLLALGCGASAFACTIPVFRFALDRWEADKFRLVVPAAWLTQPDMVRLMIPLRGNGEANVRIEESADVSATEAKLLFPHHETPLWSGKLDAATLPTLLDSPARRELVKLILSGDSVVWVVCTNEGEKAEADRVEKRLRFLEKVAALPLQDPNDPDSQLGPGPPLKLKFSVLRVSLNDPKEKLFAAMLAGPNQQELIASGTSFAAPVFGKGRVLGAWALDALDGMVIEDATLFLIGRCSCRIKNENPGWDLVLKTDWEQALAKAGMAVEDDDENAPSSPAAADTGGTRKNEPTDLKPQTFVASAPVPATAPSPVTGKVASTAAYSATYFVLGWAVAAGALAVIIAAAGFMLWFRR